MVAISVVGRCTELLDRQVFIIVICSVVMLCAHLVNVFVAGLYCAKLTSVQPHVILVSIKYTGFESIIKFSYKVDVIHAF